MVDRETIVAVLKRRFPGSAAADVAAAANAIVGLEDEWVEVRLPMMDDGSYCRECLLQQLSRDHAVRLFTRRRNH
jgi:hypothetical protein